MPLLMSRFMFTDSNLIDVSHTKNAHKFFNGGSPTNSEWQRLRKL